MLATRRCGLGLLVATLMGPHLAVSSPSQQQVRLGGVGAVGPILKVLGQAYARAHPEVNVLVMEPPLGSTGALRALQSGVVDLAFTGRPMKPGEVGQSRPWVSTPLVFVSSDASVNDLSFKDLTRIYSGELRRWPDGRDIRLVLRSAFESELLVQRSMSGEMGEALNLALARKDLPVADNDLAALDTLARLRGSLGTTSLGLIHSLGAKVKVLSVEGKVPTVRSASSGEYPWLRTFHAVHRSDLSVHSRSFLNFLYSDLALKLLQDSSFVHAR